MSRSRKKPYVKYGCPGMKKVGARMERRIVRQLLKPWRYNYPAITEKCCWGCECREWDYFDGMEYLTVCAFDHMPLEPLLPLRKQIVNSYNICDYKLYNPKEPYYYRK